MHAKAPRVHLLLRGNTSRYAVLMEDLRDARCPGKDWKGMARVVEELAAMQAFYVGSKRFDVIIAYDEVLRAESKEVFDAFKF